jgi:hypothetical protein
MINGNKPFPLVDEKPSISSDKKDNKNSNISNDKSDINEIIDLNFKKKKSEDDEHSLSTGDYSSKKLKPIENIKAKTERSINSILFSKKAFEKYTERLKERTMRMEVEKIYKETERLKNEYEEKSSNVHLFDNNPQFQKMLKSVEKQLRYFFIEGLILIIFSLLLYFSVSKKKLGLALASLCISTSEVSMSIILFISLKIGLLNDPDLSKTFRLFVILESLLLFTSVCMSSISNLLSIKYFNKIDNKYKTLSIILFILMIFVFIFIFKSCLNLFIESVLILFGKKTEYSILMINEINNKNDLNFNTSLSVSNNLTTEALYNTNNNFLNIDNNKNLEKNKEEEQYKTYNYFNKFHNSVTSSRNKEYLNYKKK